MEIDGLSLCDVDARMVNLEPSWNAPPARTVLSDKEMHIWRAFLDIPDRSVQEFKQSLSTDERARAERFRFDRDRNRFIAAHGILRRILACYMNVDPCEITFCREENGKPRLKTAAGETGIQFNLSHSEGLAIYVFTCDRRVGVDVECIRVVDEMEQIVEQFFSARERALFRVLPAGVKQEMFFNLWTRREAFLKAIGNGLSYPPDTFDALRGGEDSDHSSAMAGGAQAGPGWSVLDVRPASRFVGAVVVDGAMWETRCWQWLGKRSDYNDGQKIWGFASWEGKNIKLS